MNKFLTYCAKAKLSYLLKKQRPVAAVKLVAGEKGGFEIQFLFSVCPDSDIIISSIPLVLTNKQTLAKLNDGSIDYSYSSEEFIIKKINSRDT